MGSPLAKVYRRTATAGASTTEAAALSAAKNIADQIRYDGDGSESRTAGNAVAGVRIILPGLWVAAMLVYLLGDMLRPFAGHMTPGETDGQSAS